MQLYCYFFQSIIKLEYSKIEEYKPGSHQQFSDKMIQFFNQKFQNC